MNEILIIGAGACGLSAARKLISAGYKITILEARDRIGGRIFTHQPEGFTFPIESGAEFIHGELEVTQSLLKEYGIKYRSANGEMWRIINRKAEKEESPVYDPGEFEKLLDEVSVDIPVNDFLVHYRNTSSQPDEHLIESVKNFVEGFDAADINRASTLALKEEWLGSDDWKQFRINGGYGSLISSLCNDLIEKGGTIHLNKNVVSVSWKKNEVTVKCEDESEYKAGKIIITVPAGVLQKHKILFNPEIIETESAIDKLGNGNVIKFIIEFKSAFWKDKKYNTLNKNLDKAAFIFSETDFPAMWTQYPEDNPVLTGWMGGPRAENLKHHSAEDVKDLMFDSLCKMFDVSTEFLQNEMNACSMHNWMNDEYSCGAYSFTTVDSADAITCLTKPVENTIYFAGEALNEGPSVGTVEAALISGYNTAFRIIK